MVRLVTVVGMALDRIILKKRHLKRDRVLVCRNLCHYIVMVFYTLGLEPRGYVQYDNLPT